MFSSPEKRRIQRDLVKEMKDRAAEEKQRDNMGQIFRGGGGGGPKVSTHTLGLIPLPCFIFEGYMLEA